MVVREEAKELKLSGVLNPNCTFHTVRYDFKQATSDTNVAAVDVHENKIQVTFPSNLVFQGDQGDPKPYPKQCVLIVNHDTGEIMLEREK